MAKSGRREWNAQRLQTDAAHNTAQPNMHELPAGARCCPDALVNPQAETVALPALRGASQKKAPLDGGKGDTTRHYEKGRVPALSIINAILRGGSVGRLGMLICVQASNSLMIWS